MTSAPIIYNVVNPTVAVLFARPDSIYKSLPGTDVFDFERDALTYRGSLPVVAHPPCRAWSRLSHFAKPLPGEKESAYFAIEAVRKFGGVLEHPAGSSLWFDACLPAPGCKDAFGGFTLGLDQNWFGHRAKKSTLLYIVGTLPLLLPPIPFSLEYPSHVVQSRKNKNHISKSERDKTPLLFAQLLLDLARTCRGASC